MVIDDGHIVKQYKRKTGNVKHPAIINLRPKGIPIVCV
jgi:hypothetical protein